MFTSTNIFTLSMTSKDVVFITYQAGLDVMLSVPRQANDTMYLCMIEGFNVSSFCRNFFHQLILSWVEGFSSHLRLI